MKISKSYFVIINLIMCDMNHKYSFENLNVWQTARNFTVNIYKKTDAFPENEKYGIVNQLRRACISICSNIAEGNSRTSLKDRAHFFQIAYSSTMEVLNQLIIACDLTFITTKELTEFRNNVDEISNKLNSLYKKQLN
jgi:four helix bundle protein